MTVRLWAQSDDDARRASAGAELDPSHPPLGDLRAYLTDDPIIRCVECDTLKTSAEFVHPSHACDLVVIPSDSADDISVETNGLLRSVALMGGIVLLDIAALGLAVYTVISVARWALR